MRFCKFGLEHTTVTTLDNTKRRGRVVQPRPSLKLGDFLTGVFVSIRKIKFSMINHNLYLERSLFRRYIFLQWPSIKINENSSMFNNHTLYGCFMGILSTVAISKNKINYAKLGLNFFSIVTYKEHQTCFKECFSIISRQH